MGTEVGHASADIQTNVTAPPSTASTSAPRTSMFAKRAGFVIPKNKLSGSLVPVFRRSKKGDADSMNKETTKQVQRKTKWGPDLSMDTTVRKSRALAYQTRINQISQQLTLGVMKLDDNEDSFATSESSDHQLSREESEQLELERREVIGEILKLNPTFKAPADYKPVMKEAKVPLPIKEHPGYNFISLVFGPSSDTQKRVEKETGAKIQVYGTKADTAGQVEITLDSKEADDVYEHMFVNISADTYEKVDAAVALIELLVTSISVNPVSSSTTSAVASDDNVNTNQSQSMATSTISTPVSNQGIIGQPYPLPQSQFQQHPPQAWFPNQTPPTYHQSNASSSSPVNVNIPSLFGPRPVIPASFSPVLQNPSRPQPSYMQHPPPPPYMQQTHPPTHNIPLPAFSNAASQGSTNIGRPLNMPNDMISYQQSRPMPLPPSHFPNNAPSFDSVRPPMPSSGDFTFQPRRPPPPPIAAASQVWQSSNQHNMRHPVQGIRQPINMMHNMNPSPPAPPPHGFPRPPANQFPTNFGGPLPPRQPMNFMPHPMDGPFPPRPPRFPAPRQHFPGRPFRGQQVYDPFSPSSVAFNSQMGGNGGNAPRIPSETDPEYEDLMASVGVK